MFVEPVRSELDIGAPGAGQLLAKVEQSGVVGFRRPESVAALFATVRDEQAVSRPRAPLLHVLVFPALTVRGAKSHVAVRERLESIVMSCHLPSSG
jgi:hypothetical protein